MASRWQRSRAWARSNRPSIVKGAAGAVVAVLVGITINVVSGHIGSSGSTHGASGAPTNTSIAAHVVGTPPSQPASSSPARSSPAHSRPAQSGPAGGSPVTGNIIHRHPGWSATRIVLKNDYMSVTASMAVAQGCDPRSSGQGWVFPGASIRLPVPRGNEDQWAIKYGGIPVSGNTISLTVQGLNGHNVIITKFGVRVDKRFPVPSGVAPSTLGGCGGETLSYFAANLDDGDDVTTVAVRGGGTPPARPVVPLPHHISGADSEQWYLSVNTKHCDCLYTPYIEYTADGVASTFPVTLVGRPWEVTSAARAQRLIIDGSHWDAEH